MKIISKHKDYYDHLVSHYGYDETRVYDRRHNVLNTPRYDGCIEISICGTYYPVVSLKNKIYHEYDPNVMDHWDQDFFRCFKGKKSTLNEKFRQPVVIPSWDYKYDYKKRKAETIETYIIPILGNFGFPKIIDADEMYQRIYAYLGWLKDNPEPPDNQTDKDKVVSHGFDPKSSFRPKMKV